MPTPTPARQVAELPRREEEAESPRFLRDVLQGLSLPRKAIPSLWFYDARGSEIFQRIMALESYYPTRIEHEILARNGKEIVAPFFGRGCTVVDLGAGDGTKTRLLLEPLSRRSPRFGYAPIDISGAALADVSARMAQAFPRLRVTPIEAEYFEGLRVLQDRKPGSLLVLFLGSNIGNLEREEAVTFLRSLRSALRPGDHALVGFDLLKDVEILRGAYDDPEGVTAEFNLNLLGRMNRELGADFDVRAFEHRATFDPLRPAMESWLVSRRRQRVWIAGRRFDFEAGEAIHTEISCKYRERDPSAYAAAAGFSEAGQFRDPRGWFVDALWRVDEE
jgi:dimethylhistidine N-methyltransferase